MDADVLTAVVAGYARRFHTAALATGPAHHIASPLGAWIVLALAADALDGEARTVAASRLGCPVEDAVAAARALVEVPHPAIAAAVACWADPARLGDRLGAWAAGLPPAVETGAVPTAAEADRWAADRTDGLVETFPVAVEPATVLVLASALATRVSWLRPFALAAGSELGGPWAARVAHALTRAGDVHLVATRSAGPVVAVRSEGDSDLDVLTVSAAPEVAPVDVVTAALELAAHTDLAAGRLSLFDVPVGPGHSWDLVETVEERATSAARIEEATVVLPAWEATSAFPLLADDGFGFTEVAAHLLGSLPPHPDGWEADAAQSTTGTYGRLGFAAAAVTALSLRAGAALPPSRRVPVRTLRARFDHPHAVVAVAAQRRRDRVPEWFGPWHRLPVFSAWVAEPAEPVD